MITRAQKKKNVPGVLTNTNGRKSNNGPTNKNKSRSNSKSNHRSGFGFNSPKVRTDNGLKNDKENEEGMTTPGRKAGGGRRNHHNNSNRRRNNNHNNHTTPSSVKVQRSGRRGGGGPTPSTTVTKLGPSEVEGAYNSTCTVTGEEVRQILGRKIKANKWEQRERLKQQHG